MGFVFDEFQTLLQVNRFAARGLLVFITCLTYHRVFVGASDVVNAKEKKIGMLRIENYKNKSNMEINKKQ